MTRRTFLLTCALLLAGCSSSANTRGAGTADVTTTAASSSTTAGSGTLDPTGGGTTATPAPTTPAATTPTTPAPTTPAPTTPAPTTPAPTTPAPTAPPATTAPCRTVGNPATTDPTSISIRRGDCGEGVRVVQEALNYKMGTSIAVDGRFGPGTEAAVKAFQASVGLTADGIVGMTTWAALSDDGT